LSIASLGVVFGDIGTSPLYAVREIFLGHALPNYSTSDIIGVISVVFWALTLIITIKYVIFVLRADNDGEGGVFALYGLIDQLGKKKNLTISGLLIFASGLLLGDGIITPAISVISAVEGLKVMTPVFEPYVVPITIAILTGLFSIQSKGTSRVGSIFGPVMLIWFFVLAVLGISHIMIRPEILSALNPMHAIEFFLRHSLQTVVLVLGSIILVVTGGEAMYEDLGHFGRFPIRLSWLIVAYPALVLNYLGQGAFLLSGKPISGGNLFFSMVPNGLLFPMVILATLATIIASQALISGVFSLVSQAISLGLFPFMHVDHTHKEHMGQIYVRQINIFLFIGSVVLVLYFGSSSRMASAYGLAIAGVEFVTTLGMISIAREVWKWKK
jgi:KUP system potassium uptake protein